MSKRKTIIPTVNYLLQYLQKDATFLLKLAEHAYLLAKGWYPKWELPAGHPKKWNTDRFVPIAYETSHAVNSQKYYERRGIL